MVGDSLGSDIQGGINAGVDTCWYTPTGAEPDPVGPRPTHRIRTLDELVELIGVG
jgi:FMN phosphatase YigB (HAD superfamily)